MRILVIGSGGREHALCRAFNASDRVTKVYCANGNAGIGEIAECVDIRPDDIAALAEFAETNAIDLTFVGGESSLALGIVDKFRARGLMIVGATREAAQLESSKAFAKAFMERYSIPTARFRTASGTDEAKAILADPMWGGSDKPVVVKADGLAAGKGVIVAKDRSEAETAIDQLESVAGKEASAKIVIEECLEGREVSLILFADGKNFSLMPPVRDHKRIGEGDTGANTGGMGTVSERSLLSNEETEEIVERIVKPTLAGCEAEGFPFRGILFLGLMMTDSGPQVLEYNVRFGDPETQVILVQLKSDIVSICDAILEGRLADTAVEWREGAAACVVLASHGYPAKARIGDPIYGLDEASGDAEVIVFHAGTARGATGQIVTSGGRVLGVTATAPNLSVALERAYDAVSKIRFDGMQYRRDIGK